MPTPTWVQEAWPFLKGIIGWGAASFVVENFFKPRKARRSLAHVLAEEVSLNLQLVVSQLAWFGLHPNEIPADLKLLDRVYETNTARIGELPDELTGPLILHYERIGTINRLTGDLGRLADEIQTIKRDPDRHGGVEALKVAGERMRRGMLVYKAAFAAALEEGDFLLRKLRVLETFGGRVGYWFRKKPMLDTGEAHQKVVAHSEQLGAG